MPRLATAALAWTHCCCWASQSETLMPSPAAAPLFAALAHAFFCTSHARWIAAPALRNVAPFTLNGRSLEGSLRTGTGAAPTFPVNAFTLAPAEALPAVALPVVELPAVALLPEALPAPADPSTHSSMLELVDNVL